MVPKLSKGAGIKGTALYVLHDVRDESERAIGPALTPEQQTQHRVGFTTTRNLSTDDPELAWRLMCATARSQAALKQHAGVRAGGRPSKYQCGHIALSWEHQTQPSAAEMTRAAEGALKSLGWEKLQALIVEHKDHDHSHVHIVVNLVDPETGRNAPNSKNEYERLQRWAHEYDKARGLEVCPQRAERMERAPDAPKPTTPTRKWLSRQEYETIRDAERKEHRGQAMERYREAAAAVRVEFAPAWRELYASQRAELRGFDKQQRDTMRSFRSCARMRRTPSLQADRRLAAASDSNRRNQMVGFVNKHREAIWRGIDATNQPGNSQTLLSPKYVKTALERSYASDRTAMLERHGEAKAELQGRHTEARQDAYRQAWKRPKPIQDQKIAAPAQVPGRKAGVVAIAGLGAAAIAAGLALSRSRQRDVAVPAPDPERDLAAAAERIQRQQSRAANANEIARVLGRSPEDAERLIRIQARNERERGARPATRDPSLGFDREPRRFRD